jgi:hypothetical protein
MSDEQLNSLKEQLAPLSPQEKLKLARFLIDQAGLDQQGKRSGMDDVGRSDSAVKRMQHLAG